MPPARPFWKGYLKLSLVSCPIALYTASSSSERVSFRQINKKTGHRLKQQLVDSVTGELVESQDKGRGYEIGKKRIQGLDIQGAWTLHLLPRTSGGMWFTLNIGSHAVAFAPRKPINSRFTHYLTLDRLILDYPETVIWIGNHNGEVHDSPYAFAERAVQINFDADFANAEKIFKLAGIRRALIAYWSEALADLRERGARSSYAVHHSYDAVSELLEYKRATEGVLHPE